MGDVDTFEGRWVARVEVNGHELQCQEGCSDWYVGQMEGHCRCHATEFWANTGGVVIIRLGNPDAT